MAELLFSQHDKADVNPKAHANIIFSGRLPLFQCILIRFKYPKTA
jgi:hypothetical protein